MALLVLTRGFRGLEPGSGAVGAAGEVVEAPGRKRTREAQAGYGLQSARVRVCVRMCVSVCVCVERVCVSVCERVCMYV